MYDAYGRHKVLDASLQEDTNTSSIGNLNPFRYRGYFYDSVLGLYFLKSRYYDPETCRFISPDIISILDEKNLSINGLNLYMYCGDNPVMYVDPSVYSPTAWWICNARRNDLLWCWRHCGQCGNYWNKRKIFYS